MTRPSSKRSSVIEWGLEADPRPNPTATQPPLTFAGAAADAADAAKD